MNNKILIIDAGHGNINSAGEYTTPPNYGKKWQHSTKGYHGGGWFYEGLSNKQLAAEFIAQATRAGFFCFPVFDPIEDTSLSRRTNIANYIQSNLKAEALFISFHSNAFDQTWRGFQVYHHLNSQKGKSAAEAVADFAGPYCEEWGSPSPNPVRGASFHVLTYTQMPAILIEALFFDNEEDTDLLLDREFCSGLCAEILKGVQRFILWG